MWSLEDPSKGITNIVKVPTDGTISIVKPEGVEVSAIINEVVTPLHHVHVKAGDNVCFKVTGNEEDYDKITLEYGGVVSCLYGNPHKYKGNPTSEYEEKEMAEGINTDKVIVNAGGGGEGGGGSMAAVIAALGNRNQGSDNAALIAALGNRNGGNDGFGSGGGGIWPIVLLALLGKRGFGGDDCHDDGDSGARTALVQTIMESVADIRAQVPQTALETQNAVQQSVAALALGTQQGFANTKDSVQLANLANLVATKEVDKAVQATALGTVIAINNDGDKTRQLIQHFHDSNLQRELGVAQSALLEERTSRRVRDVEVNVAQTVNQNQQQIQAQAQAQQQFQTLAALHAQIANLANDIQVVRQTQSNVNFGVQAGSGQTATGSNTKVS